MHADIRHVPPGISYRVWLDGEEVSNRCTAFGNDDETGMGWVRLYDNVIDGRIQLPLTESEHKGYVEVVRTTIHG